MVMFWGLSVAFDSIHWGKMIEILRACGIPPNLLRAVEADYTGTKARVVTHDGTTDEFELLAGVLQGDTLTPILFIKGFDCAPIKATDNHEELGFTVNQWRSRQTRTEKISDLDFADDIAVLSDDFLSPSTSFKGGS